MNQYCEQCATALIIKTVAEEGEIPYCPTCEQLKFPKFSVAMSSLILNPSKNKLLLINQYNHGGAVLTAGYVALGEAVETTVVREIKEELGLTVTTATFLRSEYYSPSKTLMLNFLAIVDSEDFNLNQEVDSAQWLTAVEAKEQIMPNSLAERFLLAYLADASLT